MEGFWKAWMSVWCWMTLALGLVFAAAAFPATDVVARLYYDLVSGFGLAPGFLEAPAMRFTVAVLGAVLIGWAMTILALIGVADAAGRPVWRGLTAAMLTWFAIDTTLSVLTGFALNAVPNAVFVATYLAPVMASGVLATASRTPAP